MEELENPDQMNNCQYVDIQNGKQVKEVKMNSPDSRYLHTICNKNQIIRNKVVILIERGFAKRNSLL